MNDRERYRQLKEAGICVTCKSRKAEIGYVSCNECREKLRQRSQDRRAWLKTKNFCPQCGSEKLMGDEKICPECGAKKYASNRKSNKNDADYQKKRVSQLKEQGICTQCAKAKAESGKTMCRSCLNKKLVYRRQHATTLPRSEWIAYGLCYSCGKPITSGKLCEKCRNKSINNLPDKQDTDGAWYQHHRKMNKVLFGS